MTLEEVSNKKFVFDYQKVFVVDVKCPHVQYSEDGEPEWLWPLPAYCRHNVIRCCMKFASFVATRGLGEKQKSSGFKFVVGDPSQFPECEKPGLNKYHSKQVCLPELLNDKSMQSKVVLPGFKEDITLFICGISGQIIQRMASRHDNLSNLQHDNLFVLCCDKSDTSCNGRSSGDFTVHSQGRREQVRIRREVIRYLIAPRMSEWPYPYSFDEEGRPQWSSPLPPDCMFNSEVVNQLLQMSSEVARFGTSPLPGVQEGLPAKGFLIILGDEEQFSDRSLGHCDGHNVYEDVDPITFSDVLEREEYKEIVYDSFIKDLAMVADGQTGKIIADSWAVTNIREGSSLGGAKYKAASAIAQEKFFALKCSEDACDNTGEALGDLHVFPATKDHVSVPIHKPHLWDVFSMSIAIVAPNPHHQGRMSSSRLSKWTRQTVDNLNKEPLRAQLMQTQQTSIVLGLADDIMPLLRTQPCRTDCMIWVGVGACECPNPSQAWPALDLDRIGKAIKELLKDRQNVSAAWPVLVVCLKYGARLAAKTLIRKGAPAVVWCSIDAFDSCFASVLANVLAHVVEEVRASRSDAAENVQNIFKRGGIIGGLESNSASQYTRFSNCPNSSACAIYYGRVLTDISNNEEDAKWSELRINFVYRGSNNRVSFDHFSEDNNLLKIDVMNDPTILLALQKLGEALHVHIVGTFHDDARNEVSIVLLFVFKGVAPLHALRNAVLSNDVDEKLELIRQIMLPEFVQARVDKSAFVEAYLEGLHSWNKFTEHQERRLKDLHNHFWHEMVRQVHIKAAAGAGKTFVGVSVILDLLLRRKTGMPMNATVLFVACSLPLCYHVVDQVVWHLRDETEEDLASAIRRLHFYCCDGSNRDVMRDASNRTVKRLALQRPNSVSAFLLSWLCTQKLLPDKIVFEDCYCYQDIDTSYYDLMVVDEAHSVFASEHDVEFIRSVQCERRLLLSDASQCLDSDANLGLSATNGGHEDIEKELILDEVVRSSQRITKAMIPFQLNPTTFTTRSHHSFDGPMLKSIIFENSDAKWEEYATHVRKAISDIEAEYERLSLDNRIGIVVPNKDFLDCINGHLADKLADKFQLQSAEEANAEWTCKTLRVSQEAIDANSEQPQGIIIDTVENFAGLERLFIIAVGLDAPIKGELEAAKEARLQIYQACTRANMLAVVVNHTVGDGWLEYLLHLKGDTNASDEIMVLTRRNRRSFSESTLFEIESNTSAEALPNATSESASSSLAISSLAISKQHLQPLWDTSGNIATIRSGLLSLSFKPFEEGLESVKRPREEDERGDHAEKRRREDLEHEAVISQVNHCQNCELPSRAGAFRNCFAPYLLCKFCSMSFCKHHHRVEMGEGLFDFGGHVCPGRLVESLNMT